MEIEYLFVELVVVSVWLLYEVIKKQVFQTFIENNLYNIFVELGSKGENNVVSLDR